MNPAKPVKLPKNSKKTETEDLAEESKVFTMEEIEMIFDAFPPTHNFYAPIRLAWHTGMRLGECLALQWKDIDMDRQVIHVRHTLIDRNGEMELGTPKSKKSNRVIAYGKKLQEILEKVKEIQEKRKKMLLQADEFYEDNDFVCTKPDGRIVTSDNMRYFGKWCKQHLKHGSFHVIRHTHATFLLSKGWHLEEVSKRLGHSGVAITSMIYSHITWDRVNKQIESLDSLSI